MDEARFQKELENFYNSFLEYIRTQIKTKFDNVNVIENRFKKFKNEIQKGFIYSIFCGLFILNDRYLEIIYECAIKYLSNFIENEKSKYEYDNEIANIFFEDMLNLINYLLFENEAFHNIGLLNEYYDMQIIPTNYIELINKDKKGLRNIERAMKYLMKIFKNKDIFSKFEVDNETKGKILNILSLLHLYLVTIDDKEMRKDLQKTILKITETFPPLDKNIVINTLPSKYSNNFDLRTALIFDPKIHNNPAIKYEKYEDLTVPVPDYSIENNKELYNRLCTIGKEIARFFKFLKIIEEDKLFEVYTSNYYRISIWLSLIISEVIENNNIERVVELLNNIFSHEHINEIILTPELDESIRNVINYLIKQKEEIDDKYTKQEIDNIVKLIEENLNYPVKELVPVVIEQ